MKHLPTGKNKEQFEKWFLENYNEEFKRFYSLPLSMQVGVLLEYYDSIEMIIEVFFATHPDVLKWIFRIDDFICDYEGSIKRPLVQQAALEKADSLMNERLEN